MTATPVTVNSLAQNASAPASTMSDPAAVACDAVNGNTLPNSGVTALRFQNTDTAAHTVTFTPAESVGQLALEPDVRTIPASGKVWIGHLNINEYGPDLAFLASSALVMVQAFEP